MAKKKIGNIEVDTETGEVLSENNDGEKKMLDKVAKKFAKLDDYKSKIKFKDTKYKSQEWIDMSPAFKDVTKLPGQPVGSVILCHGKSNSGKSTMAIEAAAYAQKQGILPVFIITENKFSFERAETMGVNFENAIVHNGVATIEEGCVYMKETLDAQEAGDLPYDILFVWDSIGATPSKAELDKREEGGAGGGMMVTARVLREQITRYLALRINATRNENYPYNATAIFVNHSYMSPPSMPMAQPTLEPYGGDGLYLAASLVFRMGGIKSRPSAVSATKDKAEVSFAIRTSIVVEKNHVTNVSSKGKILCTDHGFLLDDKNAIDEYKKKTKDGWDLNYDSYWDGVTTD